MKKYITEESAHKYYSKLIGIHNFDTDLYNKVQLFEDLLENYILKEVTGVGHYKYDYENNRIGQKKWLENNQEYRNKNGLIGSGFVPKELVADIISIFLWRGVAKHEKTMIYGKYIGHFTTVAQTINFFSKVDIPKEIKEICDGRAEQKVIDSPQKQKYKKVFLTSKKENKQRRSSVMYPYTIKKGNKFNNDELYAIFKCANQGGMRKSNTTNTLLIVDDHTNPLYSNERKDNILLYTGMGSEGNQSFDFRQNKTLNESNINKVDILLFEVKEIGCYNFKGKVELADQPFFGQQPDKHNNNRKVCIFPLKIVAEEYEVKLSK